MRILFYEDPITDQNAFLWRAPHVMRDALWMTALIAAGCDAKMLINSFMLPVADTAGVSMDSLIIVREEALIAALPSPQLNVNTLFQRWSDELNMNVPDALGLPHMSEFRLASYTRDALVNALTSYLIDFEPDVIITWVPVPHLRRIFPDALILHKETSLLSRSPLPLTYYLDPRGFGRNAFLGHAHPIRTTMEVMTHHQRLYHILEDAMSIDDNISDLISSLSRYEASVLVAGHTNNVFFFDGACDYRSQVHLLIDVLDQAPKSWAVIATEHPDCARLTETEIAYLKAQYANFVYWSELRSRPGASQSLVRHVDAVATVSSSIGAQAVLWGKRLYAYGQTHLNRFDQGAPLSGLSGKPKSLVGDEAAPWLCFHYSYQDAQVTAPDWLAEHLLAKLDHWRTRGLEGYFDIPIRDPAKMLDAYEEEVVAKSRASARLIRAVSGRPNIIDMSNGRHFLSGWGSPEGDLANPYRWTTSKDAGLRVFIDQSYDWTISLIVGSLQHDEQQTASLFIGGVELSTAIIDSAPHVELIATIPRTLIGKFSTMITLRARQISTPPGDPRELALGVSRIVLQSI